MSNFKKSLLVVVGAIVLSVLGLQASDTLRGLDTGLSGLVSQSSGVCGTGATQILLGSHALCVDLYEASATESCPHADPQSLIATQENLNATACRVASEPEVMPWRFVSLNQAQQLCARSGKRLPTNDEWYRIASGLSDQSACVLDNVGNPARTGSVGCATPAGIHDVVGNVWEWIDAEVVDGSYNERTLPSSGYVSMVDSDGIIVKTDLAPQAEFNADYAWSRAEGISGIIRGGFYGSGTDGGIFAQNLAVPLDTKTAGVGFRCVKDI